MKDVISIVIPAYNIGERLLETLQSVSAQTYNNIEIVVVNDGSTDNTAAVLDDYAMTDSRVRAIHKENGGVTSARLRGLVEATGEWIGFVDGDDIVEPTMFERLLENAKTYGADISHCGYQMVFPDGHADYYYNTGRITEQDHETGLCDLISGEFVEPGLWNKLFHRTVTERFLRDDPMDKTIRINEDLLMNYYLFDRSEKAVYEDVCLYHYVLRKGSAATSKLNEHKLKNPLQVLDILHGETAAHPAAQKAVERRQLYQMIQTATLPLGGQKELIKPYRREIRARLRRRAGAVLKDSAFSLKLKLMTAWVAVWPQSYMWVHGAYAKITGLDKKYDVG